MKIKNIPYLFLGLFIVSLGQSKIYVTNKLFDKPVEWTATESQANEIVALIKADTNNKGKVLRRVVAYIDGVGAVALEVDGKASNYACGFDAPRGIACTLVPGNSGMALADFSKANLKRVAAYQDGSVKVKLLTIVTADEYSDR